MQHEPACRELGNPDSALRMPPWISPVPPQHLLLGVTAGFAFPTLTTGHLPLGPDCSLTTCSCLGQALGLRRPLPSGSRVQWKRDPEDTNQGSEEGLSVSGVQGRVSLGFVLGPGHAG